MVGNSSAQARLLSDMADNLNPASSVFFTCFFVLRQTQWRNITGFQRDEA